MLTPVEQYISYYEFYIEYEWTESVNNLQGSEEFTEVLRWPFENNLKTIRFQRNILNFHNFTCGHFENNKSIVFFSFCLVIAGFPGIDTFGNLPRVEVDIHHPHKELGR